MTTGTQFGTAVRKIAEDAEVEWTAPNKKQIGTCITNVETCAKAVFVAGDFVPVLSAPRIFRARSCLRVKTEDQDLTFRGAYPAKWSAQRQDRELTRPIRTCAILRTFLIDELELHLHPSIRKVNAHSRAAYDRCVGSGFPDFCAKTKMGAVLTFDTRGCECLQIDA